MVAFYLETQADRRSDNRCLPSLRDGDQTKAEVEPDILIESYVNATLGICVRAEIAEAFGISTFVHIQKITATYFLTKVY